MNFTESFLAEVQQVTAGLNVAAIEKMVDELAALRERGGRLFILGVGGSAGNASHAVNDFRKICGFEAYAPTDNVSELTARTNDEGWATVLAAWLTGSRINAKDALLIFSVGGGNLEKRQPESRQRDPTREVRRRICARHRGPRRRLHREGGERVRHRADRESRSRHTAQRGVSSDRLAPVCLAPKTQSEPHEVESTR